VISPAGTLNLIGVLTTHPSSNIMVNTADTLNANALANNAGALTIKSGGHLFSRHLSQHRKPSPTAARSMSMASTTPAPSITPAEPRSIPSDRFTNNSGGTINVDGVGAPLRSSTTTSP